MLSLNVGIEMERALEAYVSREIPNIFREYSVVHDWKRHETD